MRECYALCFASVLLGALLAADSAAAARPENPANGQIHSVGTLTEVWDGSAQAWVAPEAFWLGVASRGRGKFWGRDREYPPYSEVREHDTLLIELKQGPCLMYFFHERWRRAQDVRRWDPAFNEVGGCPYVFD